MSIPRLLASIFPEPVKDDAEAAGAPALVVLEPLDVSLGAGIPVATLLPGPGKALEPLEELFPPVGLSDGVMFLRAFFARVAKVSWVREWFLAGLRR